ncbi:ABC transporter permease [Streptococcus suis]
MFKRISALTWLRNQILLTNKNLLVQMLMPYMLVFLYKNFMTGQAGGKEIMFVCLSTAISMSVGSMISTIIAEEKEKNNLKTLILSGVRYHEYILSVLIHPLIITVVTMIAFPIITGVDLEGLYVEYIFVILMTSLAVILVNLCIGLISETQSKAQINSLPILFVVSLLPMFSGMKESVKEVVDYTFMAAYTDFFTKESFQLSEQSFKVLVLWNVALFVLTVIALKNSKKTKTSKQNFKMSKNIIKFI